MEKIGFEGGIIAIKYIGAEDFLDTAPPLGTHDEDGNPTSEVTNAATVAATYKKSQAYIGAFERIYGKTDMSLSEDEEAGDSNDITTGRDQVKGYQNITGTMDIQMLNENNRIIGAAKGNWDYDSLAYYRRRDFREYEMWILGNPNVKSLEAVSGERMYKLIGFKILRVEKNVSQPGTFRITFFARRIIEYAKWTAPSAVTLKSAQAISDTSFSLTTPVSTPDIFQTRLKLTFATVTTAADLQIDGVNIHGEEVSEVVDLSAESGAFTYITKNYYSVVKTLGLILSGGWVDGTVDVDEYDIDFTP